MNTSVDTFVNKWQLGEEGKVELIQLLNESLIAISTSILENNSVKVDKIKLEKVEKTTKGKKSDDIQRFASKKAEDFANDNDIDISEFTMMKISKKDVEEKIREKTKDNKTIQADNKKPTTQTSTKSKVICSGITKKGEICNRPGTNKPNGARKNYCFRHCEDWKAFECESDSSNSDNEEEEEEIVKNEEEIVKNEEEMIEKKEIVKKEVIIKNEDSDSELDEE